MSYAVVVGSTVTGIGSPYRSYYRIDLNDALNGDLSGFAIQLKNYDAHYGYQTSLNNSFSFTFTNSQGDSFKITGSWPTWTPISPTKYYSLSNLQIYGVTATDAIGDYNITEFRVGGIQTALSGTKDAVLRSYGNGSYSGGTNLLTDETPYFGSATLTSTVDITDPYISANVSSIGDFDGLGDFSYQWFLNDTLVSTNETFDTSAAKLDSELYAIVSWTDAEGHLDSSQSNTSKFVAINDSPDGLLQISGTAVQGDVLEADESLLIDEDGINVSTIEYRWFRDGIEISDRNESQYTLSQADVGSQIQLEIQYTDNYGTKESLRSFATNVVQNINDDPSGIATINGDALQGSTLTLINELIDIDNGINSDTLTYQWLRNGQAIIGANSIAYTTVQDDVGTDISLKVSYRDNLLGENTYITNTIDNIVNVDDPAPLLVPDIFATPSKLVEITASLGSKFKYLLNEGALKEGTSISYGWYVGGAYRTGQVLTLTAEDLDQEIKSQISWVDANNRGGHVYPEIINVTSDPENYEPYAFISSVVQNTLLTVDTSRLSDPDGIDTDTFSYQWLRDDVEIANANSASYLPTQDDVDKYLSIVITYEDDFGGNGRFTSDSIAVSNINDAVTGEISIEGDAVEGNTITFNSNIFDPDGLPDTVHYTWLRDGDAIWIENQPITGYNYTLTQDDVGKKISVRATFMDLYGNVESITSGPSEVVENINNSPTGGVTIYGDRTEGSILSAALVSDVLNDSDGISEDSPVFYQWYRIPVMENDLTIWWWDIPQSQYEVLPGEDSSSIKILQEDIEPNVKFNAFAVKINYVDNYGSSEIAWGKTSISNVNDKPIGYVSIAGEAIQGSILQPNLSKLQDSDGIDISSIKDIEWYRINDNGQFQSIHWGDSFELTNSEVGYRFAVGLTYTDNFGNEHRVSPHFIEAESYKYILDWNEWDSTSGILNLDDFSTKEIANINDAPRAYNKNSFRELRFNEDEQLSGVIGAWLRDIDGDDVTFVAETTDHEHGQLTVDTDGHFTFIPEQNFNGTTYFSYRVTDGSLISEPTEVRVQINPVDDPPIFNDSNSNIAIEENGYESEIIYRFTTEDVDNYDLTEISYSILGVDAPYLSLDKNSGELKLIDPADYEIKNEYVFTIKADDGSLAASKDYKIKVTDLNEAPSLYPTDSLAATQNIEFTYQILFYDDDFYDSHSFSALTLPNWLELNESSGVLYGTPSNADVGDLSLEVTVTDKEGASDQQSFNIRVSNVNDTPTGTVTIQGKATQGQTLTASNDLADIDGLGTISYQWNRDGSAITGATESTYVLTQDDVDKKITVTASYTDDFSTYESVTSSETIEVANVNDLPEGELSYHGKFIVGQFVTVDTTKISDQDGLPDSYEYRWYRNNQLIEGATAKYYELTEADVDAEIFAKVSYTDRYATPETITAPLLTNVTPLGDLRDLNFRITESTELDSVILTASVQLSELFTNTDNVSLLYWKPGDDQFWVDLYRNEDGIYTVEKALNRFTPSGEYVIRAINAVDNYGAAISFTEETIQIAGFPIEYQVTNSKSDLDKPQIEALTIGEFYYKPETEQWAIDYSLTLSDETSGVVPGHILELSSPTGVSLQEWRDLDENLTITATRLFPKYIASGDYNVASVRFSDFAGNEGDGSQVALAEFLGTNPYKITLDNPFGDSEKPQLQTFSLSATFNEITLRPTIIVDFSFEEPGGSGYGSSYLRLVGDQHYDDRWLHDTDDQKEGIQAKIDLVSEYVPGRFSAGWFMIEDLANNLLDLNEEGLEAGGFDPYINVYFRPSDSDLDEAVSGQSSDDWVIGSNVNDVLLGLAGDDVLYSAGGNDSVDGGDGNDLIVGGSGAGDDIYQGGEGIDSIVYTSALDGIRVDLTDGVASSIAPEDAAGIGYDRLSGIENVTAGNFNDVIIGSNSANILQGGSGNDELSGRAGDDNLNGEAGLDTAVFADSFADCVITYNSSDNSFTVSTSNEGTDVISSIETLLFNGVKYTLQEGGYTKANLLKLLNASAEELNFGSIRLEDIDSLISNFTNKDQLTPTNTQILSAELEETTEGAVDISDVISQLRHIVGLSELTGLNKAAADNDANGSVDISDVISSLRQIVGLQEAPNARIVDAQGNHQFMFDDSVTELYAVAAGDADLSWTPLELV